jgi:predicted DNA-binding transcriptional regulator AlpA
MTRAKRIDTEPALIDTPQVCALLNISRRTFERMRHELVNAHRFPAPRLSGGPGKRYLWSRAAIIAWCETGASAVIDAAPRANDARSAAPASWDAVITARLMERQP